MINNIIYDILTSKPQVNLNMRKYHLAQVCRYSASVIIPVIVCASAEYMLRGTFINTSTIAASIASIRLYYQLNTSEKIKKYNESLNQAKEIFEDMDTDGTMISLSYIPPGHNVFGPVANLRPFNAIIIGFLIKIFMHEKCEFTSLRIYRRNIGGVCIRGEGTRALATALQDPSCKLTELELEECNIGPEGAKALANALQSKNCKITSLNLGHNNIGPEGAMALANALQSKHCKITSLDLTRNKIGREGAIA